MISKRPFEGLIGDISRKIPFYLSDIKDYFNLQSIATTFYIYLVCLCTLVSLIVNYYSSHTYLSAIIISGYIWWLVW